jgi:hypothetical protein
MASGPSPSTTARITFSRTNDAYSLNNNSAKQSANGLVAIQFGGCDDKIPNRLPITKGWNYTARLFRSRKEILEEILDGTWRFPLAQPEK